MCSALCSKMAQNAGYGGGAMRQSALFYWIFVNFWGGDYGGETERHKVPKNPVKYGENSIAVQRFVKQYVLHNQP